MPYKVNDYIKYETLTGSFAIYKITKIFDNRYYNNFNLTLVFANNSYFKPKLTKSNYFMKYNTVIIDNIELYKILYA